MKKFIIANYDMYAFDVENTTFTRVGGHVSSMIDYTFIAPEDGTVVVDDKEIEVKANDVILKMYGTYDNEKDCRLPGTCIVLDKDNELAKYIITGYELNLERRKKNNACCGI